jgi:hypothetical protein
MTSMALTSEISWKLKKKQTCGLTLSWIFLGDKRVGLVYKYMLDRKQKTRNAISHPQWIVMYIVRQLKSSVLDHVYLN